jgi:hypothetical protein
MAQDRFPMLDRSARSVKRQQMAASQLAHRGRSVGVHYHPPMSVLSRLIGLMGSTSCQRV